MQTDVSIIGVLDSRKNRATSQERKTAGKASDAFARSISTA